MTAWLTCSFLYLLGGLANPPAPAVPRVLVDMPVAARIAANDSAHWKALGASGFLFHGIYDTLDAAPQDGVQDLGPLAPESALLKEIRLAVDELAEAGIRDNYLRVSIGPDAAYFSSRDAARRGVAFLEAAGIFCARAGLRGIALDLRTASPMYRVNWTGHGAEPSSTRLAAGAREFGRRGLRAFFGNLPDADILFIADDLDAAGPLWASLFEGLVESVGAADAIRLDLLVPLRGDSFSAQQEQLEALEDRLTGLLGGEARAIWRRQGGYVPVLEPLSAPGEKVTAGHTLPEHRIEVARAKLLASDYIAVRGDYGTWWRLSAKAAAGYRKLRQRGEAAAKATPKALEDAASWDFLTPFDTLSRVGALGEQKGAPFVFLDETRSAVLFWEAPEEPVRLEAGVAAALVTSLARREPQTIPGESGLAPLTLDTPLLARGLSLNDWAAPASVWLSIDEPPAVGASRVPARLGVRNVYAGPLEGSLKVEGSARISLGSDTFPLLLEPGASAVFERRMQGVFSLGERARVRVSLESPLSPGVARTFSARAHLRTRWSMRRDGPVTSRPLRLRDDQGEVFVALSEAGDIAGFSGEGRLLWQRRAVPPVALTAWPGRGPAGQTWLAYGDANGLVRVMGARGEEGFQAQAYSSVIELLFADLFAVGHDTLLVRTEDNKLHCFSASGIHEWTYTATAPLLIGGGLRARQFAPAAPSHDERLYVATRGDTPALLRLGAQGQTLWTRPLKANPQLPPVLLPEAGTHPARIAIATADGALEMFTADIGAPLESPPALDTGPWTLLAPANGSTLAAACGGTFAELDAETLQPRWRCAVAPVRHASQLRDGWLTLSTAGTLTRIASDGQIRWKDTPPHGAAALEALPADDTFLIGAPAGEIRALALPAE